MYTAIITDDNIIERDALFFHLSKIKNITVIASCNNGEETAALLQVQSADIVFSDIDMPRMNGIDLLKGISKPPVFIFISSFPEYAAESYNLDAIDYIIKPASFERVKKAVDKAIEYIEIKNNTKLYSEKFDPENQISEFGSRLSTDEFFFIKENNNYSKLNIQDITYIESMGDFSKIHINGQKKSVVLVSLKNIERQLSPKIFRRIHRQYIINLLQIGSVTNTEVQLLDKTIIPISSSYRQSLIESVVEGKLLKRFGD
ncbi:LytR/AlgR family response regulator transcription factor [Sediminibacterium goheungense]|uniref:LytTR family two component transcriptional regulator n=1 Tax=Sediminibacterium goheungense TaxID=1086393 RepID=A0A4R6IYR9_9BACT|nr:LytTR family DNA-binding domain-containing protein [Sediminibacterium goheungense]TDO27999.1 LytTR family two component transcriptional regulator [Sediminibacterium goheungense]